MQVVPLLLRAWEGVKSKLNMDPNELIKHAPELLKGGVALAGALKLTDVIKAMLGPATAEIAERFRDEVRRYRYGRQLDCLMKAEKMAKDAGFTPKAVPIKLLFPLLEGASLEENEDLHTMWAALLANASSPNQSENVRPGFTAILKNMAHDEAKLLKWIREHEEEWPHNGPLKWFTAQSELGFTTKGEAERAIRIDPRMATCLDGLEAQQLIRRRYWLPDSSSFLDEESKYGRKQVAFTLEMTERGVAFLEACSPPKPKQTTE
jgi:hypothetical protein